MSKKHKIKIWSSEQKSRIVLELLKEENTLSELASKYEVSTKTIANWRRTFLANASFAFEPLKAVSEYKDQLDDLREQNDALAKALGKATVERDWLAGKLKGLDLSNKKSLISTKPDKLSKTRQCELLDLNRSSLYYKEKEMSVDNKNIINKIDQIFTDHPVYGYRYIHKKLQEDGIKIGKDRVLKYMNIIGIKAIYPKKKRLTSVKDDQNRIYGYLLDKYWTKSDNGRTVNVANAGEVWSGDITYIRTGSGFMYLSAIIDWNSKALLSYKLSNSMDASLATDVLHEALNKYPAPKIFNSDQGSQYTSHEHTKILQDNNIGISMNGKGRSIDNIVIERFFRTLKYNCIFINDFNNIKELKKGIGDYIDHYNYRRFHSAIGYQKPMNFYLNQIQNAMPIAA